MGLLLLIHGAYIGLHRRCRLVNLIGASKQQCRSVADAVMVDGAAAASCRSLTASHISPSSLTPQTVTRYTIHECQLYLQHLRRGKQFSPFNFNGVNFRRVHYIVVT